jgi:hypothetical protein
VYRRPKSCISIVGGVPRMWSPYTRTRPPYAARGFQRRHIADSLNPDATLHKERAGYNAEAVKLSIYFIRLSMQVPYADNSATRS